MYISKHNRDRNAHCGTVLIVTIWIVLVLASLVIVLGQYVRVEAMAASNQVAQSSAEMIADGAVQYALCMLSTSGDSAVSYAANPYEAVPAGKGRFWLLRPNLEDDRHHDFGLIDEAGKVNLNSASLEMLLKLPSMTSELANSIIDWRDGNQEISTGGAESEYYLLLPEPYYCKDAPLETVDEVLLIKGGDRAGLYGEDDNRNGVLDDNENDAESSPPSDNSNGKLDAGFFHYVTVHSSEANVDAEGNPRINVRDNSPENQNKLLELLRSAVGSDQALLLMPRFRGQYANLIDLYFRTGMSYEDYSEIIDKLSMTDNEVLRGLINVNTAPEKVLLCLPGLEQTDVDALIRERTKSEDLNSILWVTRALEQDKAVGIGSYITNRSFQCAADITAVSDDGRAFCRYYVVIDESQAPPQVLFRQPLHHLGWSLDPQILEDLRGGKKKS